MKTANLIEQAKQLLDTNGGDGDVWERHSAVVEQAEKVFAASVEAEGTESAGQLEELWSDLVLLESQLAEERGE